MRGVPPRNNGRMPQASHARRPSRFRRESILATTAALTGMVLVALAVALPSLGRSSANPAASPDSTAGVEPTSEPVVIVTPSPAEPAPIPTVEFTLVAAGDILTHAPVNRSATSGGVIDYSPLMANLDPYVSGADLAICHLEVPVAPPGTAPSGYPMFGAPAEIVRDLQEAGWDGCTTASNHSVDRKFAGIEATHNELVAYSMGVAGTATSAEEAARVQFYSVRQGQRVVKVANISFTYGLNGLPMPANAPWAVNVFNADAEDAAPIIAAAAEARAQGADIVVASVHCCVEYRIAPTAAQRSIAEQIAASGLVDLYIGHHAHVPQPIELLPGGVYGEGMWTAFGLGNYLSNQDTQCCVSDTNSGVLLTATFSVSPEGKTDVGVEWTAVTVDRLGKHTMYATREALGGVGRLSANEVQARLDRVANAVGPQAPERTAPPTALADDAYFNDRRPWQPVS